jgi:hypothetical protein
MVSKSTGRGVLRLTKRRTRVAVTTLFVASAVAAVLTPAHAGTSSVTGGADPGTNPPVVRQSSVTITDNQAAQMYYRSGTQTNINNNAVSFIDETSAGVLFLGSKACLGDNPAGTNLSPRDIVTVADPANNVVATATSPVRVNSLSTSLGQVANPQPAPSNTNYRGDYPLSQNVPHGFSFSVDLTGKPAGTYTVTTTSKNMIKSDVTGTGAHQGTCQIGHPDATNKITVLGPVVSTTTFIYRPWQNTFTDIFGHGKVFANTVPVEYQYQVNGNNSAIFPGGSDVHFWTLPLLAPFTLPADPEGCLANPASCLPATAAPCDPSTGCTPRLMFINQPTGTTRLHGIFDLGTKAFVATVNFNGTQRIMASFGPAQDAALHGLISQLEAAAAAKGIDLATLLATQVVIGGKNFTTTLSLLDALQITPTNEGGATGIHIITDPSVQAGILLDVYLGLGGTCTSRSASSGAGSAGFTPSNGIGYTVQQSDLLPAIPQVGPLGALVGGPIYHITGNFGGTVLADTAGAVIGLDTSDGGFAGYPVWLEPFLGSGHMIAPRTMDFLGTATWSASETSLGSFGCLSTDFLLGAGVAVYNNPLPVGFGTLLSPAFTPSPAAATLINAINTAVQGVVTQVGTNPLVGSLLTQIVGALP